MRRRRKRDEGSSGGTWLTTYADMMTLLLSFFVLLFAFSSIDAGNFQAIVRSLQQGFGILQSGTSIIGDDIAMVSPGDLGLQQLNSIFDRLATYLDSEAIPGVSLEMDERGVTIRFADQVFFDLGKADLKPEARRILDSVAPTLGSAESYSLRGIPITCQLTTSSLLQTGS